MAREYTISNEKDSERFFKIFEKDEECRHFIINHLDLSKEWSFSSVPHTDTKATSVLEYGDAEYLANLSKELVIANIQGQKDKVAGLIAKISTFTEFYVTVMNIDVALLEKERNSNG